MTIVYPTIMTLAVMSPILFPVGLFISYFLMLGILKKLFNYKNEKKILISSVIVTSIGIVIDFLFMEYFGGFFYKLCLILTNDPVGSMYLSQWILPFLFFGIIIFLIYYSIVNFYFKIKENKVLLFALIMAITTNPLYLLYLVLMFGGILWPFLLFILGFAFIVAWLFLAYNILKGRKK